MTKLTIFIQPRCPFCKKAISYIKELNEEDPKFKSIEIEYIDELIEVDRANSYDYYYVPTIYQGNRKLHEGGIYKNEIKELFETLI